MADNRIDLRLLECLEVLVAERHVTKAADRLGTSQPKLSGALARLRKITGDPLLVRTPQGMVPTELARQLADESGNFRRRWDELVDREASFVPETDTRIFRIHTGDFMVRQLLVRVMAEMRKIAPRMGLSIMPPHMRAGLEILETGDVDVAIGATPSTPKDLFVSQLASYKWACVVAANHPRIRSAPTLEQYVSERHATLTFGRAHEPWLIERQFDSALSNLGVQRQVGIYVPNILVMPDLVAATDLVAMMPVPLANDLVGRGDLRMFEAPYPTPTSNLSMSWHARTKNDPANRWFRDLLRRVARSLDFGD